MATGTAASVKLCATGLQRVLTLKIELSLLVARRCRTRMSARRSLSRGKPTLHEQAISVAFDPTRTSATQNKKSPLPTAGAMAFRRTLPASKHLANCSRP